MLLKKVKKRNGKEVVFDQSKIRYAIERAMESSGEGNEIYAKKVTSAVMELLNKKYDDQIPDIEEVQDAVEISLMRLSLFKTAKSYIIYRYDRSIKREKRLRN